MCLSTLEVLIEPVARDVSTYSPLYVPPGATGSPRAAEWPLADGARLVLEAKLDKGYGTKGQALPAELSASRSTARGSFLGNDSAGGAVKGTLTLGGAKVGFALAPETLRSTSEPNKLESYVMSVWDQHQQKRVTVIDAANAIAVEASIETRSKRLALGYRKATVTEVRRQEAYESLEAAEAGSEYDRLHAQIVMARARGVSQRRLDAASLRLKSLTPDVASKEELKSALTWARVTSDEATETGAVVGERTCSLPGCGVGGSLVGEVLDFESSAAAEALSHVKLESGVTHDRWLFERIAEAAIASANDGGVWKSGGKMILSAPSRNQSPVALGRYLTSLGQGTCAAAIDALVRWTEAKYDHHVSAVQINVHLDASNFHAQHRDIYGLDQRDKAGRDCTCSFEPNIATACLSLGSTRRCLVEAETDDYSDLSACCPQCEGYSCSHWLRSGTLMYFNDVWNRSHTHGIPPYGGDLDAAGSGGPRISIALLCAEGRKGLLDVCPMAPRGKQHKNIYSALIDPSTTLTARPVLHAPTSGTGSASAPGTRGSTPAAGSARGSRGANARAAPAAGLGSPATASTAAALPAPTPMAEPEPMQATSVTSLSDGGSEDGEEGGGGDGGGDGDGAVCGLRPSEQSAEAVAAALARNPLAGAASLTL